jgi:hypothetical protein
MLLSEMRRRRYPQDTPFIKCSYQLSGLIPM